MTKLKLRHIRYPVFQTEAGAIRTILGQRSKHVGDSDDAGFPREITRYEPVGITGAIQFFVMLPRDDGHFAEGTDALENQARNPGMLMDSLPLAGAQHRSFIED